MTTLRTNSDHPDFKTLVVELDAYLRICDGDEHEFYSKLNVVEGLQTVVVAYDDGKPVGCGAFREYAPGVVELKRMYVLPAQRGTGVSREILNELERWYVELNYHKCILETGKNQPEAIRFYQKNGFHQISNFGKYIGVENSVCFERQSI